LVVVVVVEEEEEDEDEDEAGSWATFFDTPGQSLLSRNPG
jgi:hypothetical protein